MNKQVLLKDTNFVKDTLISANYLKAISKTQIISLKVAIDYIQSNISDYKKRYK